MVYNPSTVFDIRVWTPTITKTWLGWFSSKMRVVRSSDRRKDECLHGDCNSHGFVGHIELNLRDLISAISRSIKKFKVSCEWHWMHFITSTKTPAGFALLYTEYSPCMHAHAHVVWTHNHVNEHQYVQAFNWLWGTVTWYPDLVFPLFFHLEPCE